MTVYLIDASPIFYKAFFAIPKLNSKNGVPTNAAYGFANTMIKIIKKFDPEYLGVCFDLPQATFRKDIYSAYKQDRKRMSDDLSIQIPIVKEISEMLGARNLSLPGYEADDVIGMAAHWALEKGASSVIIISPDKDLCQLVNDKIKVYDIYKNEMYDTNKVKEKWGVYPHQIVDYLAIMGDASDGIPGIAGIGKKTAEKLINENGSLDKILENAPTFKKGIKEKIEAGADIGRLSYSLAKIVTEMKLPIQNIWEIRKNIMELEKTKDFFEALNFRSLIDKLDDIDS